MEQIKFQALCLGYISWIFKLEWQSHSDSDSVSPCSILKVSSNLLCGLSVKLLHTQGEKFLLNLQVLICLSIFLFLFGRYLMCFPAIFLLFPWGQCVANSLCKESAFLILSLFQLCKLKLL